MINLLQIFQNKIFLSSFVAGMGAQIIKYILKIAKSKKIDKKDLLKTVFGETGGMPSSHSSIVIALVTSIFITEGVTTSFNISLAFSLITIRDSLGVRYMSGVQAEYLNGLSKELEKYININTAEIKVVKGHKKKEVLTGILLGIISAWIVCYHVF